MKNTLFQFSNGFKNMSYNDSNFSHSHIFVQVKQETNDSYTNKKRVSGKLISAVIFADVRFLVA